MKNVLLFLFSLIFSTTIIGQPDTETNRYATADDAAYWRNVNEGDYIFFKGNANNGKSIYARSNVLDIQLSLGKKILIWKGEYTRIFIEGTNCASTAEQPTIITNLGGQVKWGYSEEQNTYRTLELIGFEHVYLTGKYDKEAQTGNNDFLGHNNGADLDKQGYYKKYGLWGNPRWSGTRFNDTFSNIVRISGFKTCKLSYVAATEGGFAGFNIKTDNPDVPGRVEIDMQDCFAGWTESEGAYISYSSKAEGQDLTKLTMRNNIFAFCGTEGIQTDNLTEGSVIENNIVFVAACFFRRPFQDKFQDGLHQFSFVEGGVTVRHNIMLTGSYWHQIRFKDPGAGRANPATDKPVTILENYYGYSRENGCYVWNGDGITPYLIESNIYGPVSIPTTRDAYTGSNSWDAFFKVCNSNTDITFKNNIFPIGRDLLVQACGAALVTKINNQASDVPNIIFRNSGFSDDIDYRKFTFWSATYETADKSGVFIPYKTGDYVFYYDNEGNTKFFKCIADHQGSFNPNLSPQQWDQISWDGQNLPPLDLRIEEGSHYDGFGMGLSFTGLSLSSVENVENKTFPFSIYPNPAKNEVVISGNNFSKAEIYNLQGKLLFESNRAQIALPKMAKGVYIVRIYDENDNNHSCKLYVEE